jgi:hypothetical protein
VSRVRVAPRGISLDARVKQEVASTRLETTNNRGTTNSLAMLMILSIAAVMRTISRPRLFPSRV